jgi:hypothetical protein
MSYINLVRKWETKETRSKINFLDTAIIDRGQLVFSMYQKPNIYGQKNIRWFLPSNTTGVKVTANRHANYPKYQNNKK